MLCVALFPLIRCASGASCRPRLLWALLVCFCSVLLVRAREPALRLGVCLPLLFVLQRLFPSLRPFVTFDDLVLLN